MLWCVFAVSVPFCISSRGLIEFKILLSIIIHWGRDSLVDFWNENLALV